eukprot:EC121315.1.p1 GENE.EC121315.1~~EC121315.1.p1  ORF type:complete len:119 (-),score=3.37 EC121315.1:75-431(-)
MCLVCRLIPSTMRLSPVRFSTIPVLPLSSPEIICTESPVLTALFAGFVPAILGSEAFRYTGAAQSTENNKDSTASVTRVTATSKAPKKLVLRPLATHNGSAVGTKAKDDEDDAMAIPA